MGPPQGRAEGEENLPCPAAHTPPNAPQDPIGLLGTQGTLLAPGHPVVPQHSQSLSAQLGPVTPWDAGGDAGGDAVGCLAAAGDRAGDSSHGVTGLLRRPQRGLRGRAELPVSDCRITSRGTALGVTPPGAQLRV